MNEDKPEPAGGAPENPQAASSDGGVEPQPESEAPAHEIDLNPLFPDAEKDLNSLFPDEEMKQFLKSVSRNKKDLSALNERFIQENQRDDTVEGAP